jgi:membrane fusion protein, multidrug efflux system
MSYFKRFKSRRLIYAAGAVVIVTIAAVGISYRSSRPAAPGSGAIAAVPVTAGLAVRQDVPEIVSAVGTVQSIDSVAVQARVSGTIEKIEFTPGQNVKQGQELFLIDPRPFQAALDATQAQLAHDEGVLSEAELDLTRFQLLAQQNSIAKQQAQDQFFTVQQDKGTVQFDQANVETAKLNLAYSHVASPISGRAGALLVDLGNLVGSATGQGSTSGTATAASGSASSTGSQTVNGALVTIAQIKPIYVSFNVPQTLLDQIKRNQAVAPLEVDAYSQAGKLLEKGRLTIIDNQVNINTGTVLLQGTFGNADETLWPGEFVRVRLTMAIRKDAVTIAQEAVMAGPSGSYVYVINPDMRVHRVDVILTDRQDGIAVIAKGLSGGEKVVTDGQYRLDNNTKVTIRQTTEPVQKTEVSSE